MKALAVLALLAPVVGPEVVRAQGVQEPEGQVVADQLRMGMTRAEVRALYPSALVPINDRCRGELSATYSHGRLSSVSLSAQDRDRPSKNCREAVRTMLVARFGAPETSTRKLREPKGGMYGGGVTGTLSQLGKTESEYLHNDEWSAAGLKVAFGYNESNKTSWWASFEIDRK